MLDGCHGNDWGVGDRWGRCPARTCVEVRAERPISGTDALSTQPIGRTDALGAQPVGGTGSNGRSESGVSAGSNVCSESRCRTESNVRAKSCALVEPGCPGKSFSFATDHFPKGAPGAEVRYVETGAANTFRFATERQPPKRAESIGFYYLKLRAINSGSDNRSSLGSTRFT